MYTPFLVAPFDAGVSKYLKPWMQPEDALVDMQDCYTYRGSIQKRYGYSLYGKFPNTVGIKSFAVGNGTNLGPFTGNLDYTPVGKRSIAVTHTVGGVVVTNGVDDGAGVISGTNIAAGTINYVTGAVSITFTVAPDINTPIRITYGVRIAVGDGVTTTFPFALPTAGAFGLPIYARHLVISNTSSAQQTSSAGDTPNSAGTIGTLGPGTAGMSGSVTYSTGVGTVTFNTAPPAAAADQDIWATWEFIADDSPIKGINFFWKSDGSQNTTVWNNKQMAILDPMNFTIDNVAGSDIFNTSTKAFFSSTNYLGNQYFVNNTDRLTIYDGTNVFQPIISFTKLTPTVNELTTALHIIVFKNRLIVFRPTENGVVKPQRARYSASRNPLDWISNERGHGGFIDAPTAEWIVNVEFLRDEVIVGFQDSTWKLRYTGIDLAPFRWEKINDSRRVDAPYASVSFQNFVTELGATGAIRCDGVNVERYDDKIIDYTLDNIDQDNIDNSNSFRFDQLNQQFICHPSLGLAATDYSDQWLVWNFLENSFSIWNIDSTCFGAYYQGRDLAWEDFTAANGLDWAWEDFNLDDNWFSFYTQGKTKITMFGDKVGNLYSLLPFFGTDNGTKTGFSFTTKDYNPFVKDAKQCRLGYVDFYFDAPSAEGDPDEDYLLTISFYVNENEAPYKTVTLNPSLDNFKKKRVYSGAIANFHRFKVYLNDEQIETSTVATKGFILNAYCLYMQPAGRIIG